MVPGEGLDLEPKLHQARGYTPMDRLVLGYLFIVVVVMLAGPRRPEGWWGHFLFHLGLFIAVGLARFVPRKHPILRIVRDWYPIAILPQLYAELTFVNQIIAEGYYDGAIIALENRIFGTQPAIYLRDWLPSRLLSEYLHLSYFLYLSIVPVCGFFFYVRRELQFFRSYVTTILLTFFVCYTVFILYPVAGPYYTFPRPDPAALGYFMPKVTRSVLESGAAMGAAFPSSHVAVSVASAVVVRRLNRMLFWILFPVVAGITVGTVYGGFHYAVDAVAGVIVGLAFGFLGPALYRKWAT